MITNSEKIDIIDKNLVTQFQNAKFYFTQYPRKVKKIRKFIPKYIFFRKIFAKYFTFLHNGNS